MCLVKIVHRESCNKPDKKQPELFPVKIPYRAHTVALIQQVDNV